MRHSEIIQSLYKDGTMCHQYSIQPNGNVDAVVDPLVVADTDADTLDAAKAKNDKIIAALVAVEAVETAKRINEPDEETPKTITSTDMDGEETTSAHPSWAAYDAAQATISGASEATNQFVTVRSLGVQTETLPKTETTTEPILNEDGNDSGLSRVVVTVVEGETIDNPDFAAWKAAWDAVDADLN